MGLESDLTECLHKLLPACQSLCPSICLSVCLCLCLCLSVQPVCPSVHACLPSRHSIDAIQAELNFGHIYPAFLPVCLTIPVYLCVCPDVYLSHALLVSHPVPSVYLPQVLSVSARCTCVIAAYMWLL